MSDPGRILSVSRHRPVGRITITAPSIDHGSTRSQIHAQPAAAACQARQNLAPDSEGSGTANGRVAPAVRES